MDRPSFQFEQFGMIGMGSPMRQYEDSFRENGVDLYVHQAPFGQIDDDLHEDVYTDLNDLNFLARFQDGIKTSSTFRTIQIARGNYGAAGTHEDVARKMIEVNLMDVLS